MAEDYLTNPSDAAMSFPYGESMTSEERRLQTLRNFAMSKASKARKKRKNKSDSRERKLSDAERRAQEQARIREEREQRRARSEENRRQAGIGAQTASPELLPDEETPKFKAPETGSFQPEPESYGPEIDIDLPPEPKKKAAAAVRSKKKKRTKHKQAKKRATPAARYSQSAAASNPNRITTSGAVTLGILTGVLIGTVIYGRVQTNEVYTKIAESQAVYEDLTARNVSMKSEMESKLTVKKIEEYAENELGLRPLNRSQIEYIQLQTEDEITITEPESNFFVTVNDYLVGIWEYLRGK